MFCVSVDFIVREDHLAAFLARMKRQAEESLALEPGCRTFEVWTAADRPGTVHLHEVYDDAAAFTAHLASAHFRSFDAEVADMLRDKIVTLWDRQP